MSPTISVVVPVYNVERFLHKCLDSIISQTYKDIEVLLIDDGSTDSSGRICDEYAAKDNRLKVYHKQNGGVSSARNYALEKVSGEWIYFCDADDVLYNYTLDLLLEGINDNVVSSMGGYVTVDDKYKILKRNEIIEKSILSIEETLQDFYSPIYTMFNGYLVTRLLKNDIIKNNHLRFREDIYIKEDGLFLVQYLCHCKGCIVYNTIPVYQYVMHSSSAMHSKFKTINNISLSRLVATIECYNEIKKSNYKSVLPLAKKYIFIIRGFLLAINKANIITKIKNRIRIDFLVVQAIGITPLLKDETKRIAEKGRRKLKTVMSILSNLKKR